MEETMINKDRIGSVVEHAVRQLTEGNGDVVVGLLQSIPKHHLAEAMVQEFEDGTHTGDYSLLHAMNDVLCRALVFQECSL